MTTNPDPSVEEYLRATARALGQDEEALLAEHAATMFENGYGS